MSKSTGNYIGIDEPPDEQYGKVMSLPDTAMPQFFRLVTRFSSHQVAEIEGALKVGSLHPRDAKMELAREIVSIYHGDDAAEQAEVHFKQVFQRGLLPDDMPKYVLTEPMTLMDVIASADLASSKSQARRLIGQNAVSLDGYKITDIGGMIEPRGEQVLRVGRRRFLRIVGS